MNSWSEFWQGVSTYDTAIWIGVVVGSLIFLVMNWKKVVSVVLTVQQVITLTDDISYIRKQLTNNGGSTVKDAAQYAALQGQQNAKEISEINNSISEVTQQSLAASKIAHETQDMLAQYIMYNHSNQGFKHPSD